MVHFVNPKYLNVLSLPKNYFEFHAVTSKLGRILYFKNQYPWGRIEFKF
jgi:hypothetical protein